MTFFELAALDMFDSLQQQQQLAYRVKKYFWLSTRLLNRHLNKNSMLEQLSSLNTDTMWYSYFNNDLRENFQASLDCNQSGA